MDDITTRAIVIAVNIFITITIVSLVVIMFFQMREIYGVVATTDTSIYNKFNDVYSMYHGKVETGIGLLNTLKKYEESNDGQVIIVYPDSEQIRAYVEGERKREAVYLKELMEKNKKHEPGGSHKFTLENKYNVIVEDNNDQTITIRYQSIN